VVQAVLIVEVGVRHVVVADVPSSIDSEDVEAVGRWIAETLRDAGISQKRATFAIARERVSLKRMTLPSDDVYELPEMVRFAMRRELPFDPEDAVIDYVPVESAGGQTTAMVAAIPKSHIEQLRQVAKAAGLRVERISLRCMGVATLLRTLTPGAQDDEIALLGIDVTGDGVELGVTTGGSIRFSRAAAIAQPDDSDDFADAVVTETRRSWMSYRIVEDAPEVSGAYVIGEERVTAAASGAIGDLMNVRAETLDQHPSIESDRQDLRSTWPLAGLLLEGVLGIDSFDFSNPRQAPDRYARVRQMALGAAGLLLVLAVLGIMLANRKLDDLEQRRTKLMSAVQEQAEGHYRYERDLWRMRHLQRWDDGTVDWLDHLLLLQRELPPPDQLVLDEWSGSLRDFRIDYDRSRRDENWVVGRQIIISVEGEAKTQAIVDAFRRSLAENEEYEVRPAGPDSEGGSRYPYPFKLTLRTNQATPLADETDEGGEQVAASGERTARGGEPGS